MPEAKDIHDRALALGRAGRVEAAVACLEAARATIAAHAPSLGLLGTLLSMSGRHQDALIAFEQSITLDPGQAVVHADMGVAHTKLLNPEKAVACFDRALDLDPDNLAARCNRAGQLIETGEPELALADTERALAIRADLALAHRYRGRALSLLGRDEEALASIDAALALDGANMDAHGVRSAILNALGRFDEGLAAIERAVTLQPPGEHTHSFARGLARLRLQDFGAWPDYERRWDTIKFFKGAWEPALDVLPGRTIYPRREDFAGKRVLLLREQGVGDQIMFASIIPEVLAVAASVTLLAEIRLTSLFEHSFPRLRTVNVIEDLDPADFDLVVPLGSLAHAFRAGPEAFPGTPYLSAAPQTIAAWRERLGPRTAPLRVGISWRGGSTGAGKSARSLSLDALRPLLTRPDCEFVSLQYGKAGAEVEAANRSLPRPIRLFPREDTENFESLAGLVCALDLVVSVQTSLIHLSGALGAPCLVMIPFLAEWRYGAFEDTMPWYGSVRLHRQNRPGEWGPVITSLGEALERVRVKCAPVNPPDAL